MLSQQPSKTPTTTDDRRQHQRQHSTPTVFEAPDTSLYPAPQHLAASHRRGMSLNQPQAHYRQQHAQDDHLVGITNSGHSQQHYLQEAQQHCQARPGLHQHQQQLIQQQQQQNAQPIQLSEQEFRNLQHQQLDAHIDSLFHSNGNINNNPHSFNNNGQHVVKIERSRSHPEPSHGLNPFPPTQRSANGSPAQVLLDPHSSASEQGSGRRPGARSDAGDDVPSRRNWTSQSQRPYTPPDQCSNAHKPLTPGTSPYMAYTPLDAKSEQMARNGSHGDNNTATIRAGRSPVKQPPQSSHSLVQMAQSPGQMGDPNATIKARHRPAHLQAISNSDLLQGHMEISTEALPSPPHSATIRQSAHVDVAFMPAQAMDHLHLSFSPAGSENLFFDSTPSLHSSAQTSPQMSPVHGSPEAKREVYRGDVSSMVPFNAFPNVSSPSHTAHSSIDFDILDSPERAALSPGAMSISDLNLDATIEDTGISAEEVQAYISQPDPESGKWTCLYPECGKTFGRKENVRAHVQTHLGDRQFKCIHCGKCFVRQHDLKRHSKTHSGVKPYPCRCGNSFARHDALTRHRQRGICSGGFEGVVKKVAKRGRPRKERPNHDDRVDKAARTRKRAAAKSYASSVSGTSDSSFPDSPPFVFDGVEFEASKAGALQSYNPQSFTLDPEMLNFTPPASPYSSEGTQSPRKARSAASGHTPKSTSFDEDQTAAIFEGMNVTDSSQTNVGSNVGSQVGSPPELSHSSPPSSTRLLDFDFGPNFNSSGSGPSDGNKHDSTSFDSLSLHLANSPDDLFTSSWNENTFLNFEKETSAVTGNMFSTSFDDAIMFSDNCEPGDGFF